MRWLVWGASDEEVPMVADQKLDCSKNFEMTPEGPVFSKASREFFRSMAPKSVSLVVP